jgi:uncharacterized protein
MLTSEEALAEFDFQNGAIVPDRLTRPTHAHYIPIAEQLLQTYSNSIGATRQRVHQRAESILEQLPDCSSRRMAAFIKLLDDVCEYESDRGRKAAKLRQQVFQIAAARHPLVSTPAGVFTSDQLSVKREIAQQLGKPWEAIERMLYSDVVEFHPLKAFHGYESASALLARYNVAQVQACLYRATRMTLWAKADLKSVVRIIKLSRLIHTIRSLDGNEYQFTLNGPASALRSTRRYGVAMAKMIPSLLACHDWRLAANISIGSGKRQLLLTLSSAEGLTSPKPAANEFDSEVEADLMKKWEASPVDGWTLQREAELLVRHQKVFLPDFQLTHSSGRRIHLEIIGYWTPEYILAKLKTLQEFAEEPIWIIAQKDRQQDLSSLPRTMLQSMIWYKTKISLKDLAERLSSCIV